MRRLVTKFFFATAATAIVGLGSGCEDGPSQTYSVAPPGAGSVWNGGGQGAVGSGQTYVPTSTQSLDASTQGGTNANVLCTAAEVHARRLAYFGAPISPPGLAAGLDIAGGPKGDGASGYCGPQGTGVCTPTPNFVYDGTKETWTGATVEQAEKVLCQGSNVSNIFTGITTTVAWGDAEEVAVLYAANNRVISDVLLQTGYEGAVSATSVDGKTTYNLQLNNQPMTQTVGGTTSPIFLDWNSQAGVTKIHELAEGLYDALRNKFSPDIPSDCTGAVPATCNGIAAGHIIIGNNGAGGGYLWFTPIGFIPFVSTTIGSTQANSTFTLIDQAKLKLLPFSSSNVTMQFDPAGVGPTAISPNIAGTTKTCNYQLGMKFSDFDANCVQVYSDPKLNAIATAKLYGALGHSDEAYVFDVVGIDPNFVATTIADNSVIFDNTTCAATPGGTGCPAAGDTAYSLNVDQQFLGALTNDYTGNDATQAQDFHGIGLVTLETAWLVQKYMQAVHGVTTDLGDPDCIKNAATPGVAGKVCSGIEGILTSAPVASIAGLTGLTGKAATQMVVNAIGNVAQTIDGNLAVGLKPGTWYAAVCKDGGGLDGTGKPIGYKKCADNYYFTEMQNAIASSFGGATVPADIADRRFYFQQFILATVKYLHSANDPNATLKTIDANVAVPDDLFFDSNGGGFESGIYVDRLNVNSLGQAPTVLTIGTNLTTSVLNNFSFERHSFRGERLVYTAVNTNAADKPGAEGLLISNLVGSPVLNAVYPSYACAVNASATPVTGSTDVCCTDTQGNPCPTIATGPLNPATNLTTPLYQSYAGAFGNSFLHIAANGQTSAPNSPIVVNPTGFELIQNAQVTVPIWSNPYDPTTATAADKTVTVLVPYLPKSAGVGFPVTLDGSRDKFYNTFNVDLTGTSFNGNVDFDYATVPVDGGASVQQIIVRAVETQNYLGQVFACAEPSPTDPNANCNPHAGPIESCDILSVRMYDNGNEILDYLTAHPSATTDCGFVIKYSIYGNYADYITSLTNGIRFGLTPGFGGAVVTDVTLFDPNVVAGLGN